MTTSRDFLSLELQRVGDSPHYIAGSTGRGLESTTLRLVIKPATTKPSPHGLKQQNRMIIYNCNLRNINQHLRLQEFTAIADMSQLPYQSPILESPNREANFLTSDLQLGRALYDNLESLRRNVIQFSRTIYNLLLEITICILCIVIYS